MPGTFPLSQTSLRLFVSGVGMHGAYVECLPDDKPFVSFISLRQGNFCILTRNSFPIGSIHPCAALMW